jgi:hypothetical protein
VACVVAVAGCGLGPGASSSGTASLTVTRDYGSKTLVEAEDTDPPESDTVIRVLDREADITTRYGGGFVQSIDGLSGTESGGRRYDWFFYVNGVESPIGSADVRVHAGDRIWWDYRDWTGAMRVPAVVGSWPEPFAQASTPAEARLPVRVECATSRPVCGTIADRLAAAGANADVERIGAARAEPPRALRILVGPWASIRRDPAASLDGPASSGVFATFKPGGDGRFLLVLADPGGSPRQALRSDAGLVAAVEADGEPTWLVTGTDAAGVERAAALLDSPDLDNHYAVATRGRGGPIPVPVDAASGASG